jgi:hypothetical protein
MRGVISAREGPTIVTETNIPSGPGHCERLHRPPAPRQIFNYHLDAVTTLFLVAVVALLIVTSAREWWLVLSKRKAAVVHETPFVETALVAGD